MTPRERDLVLVAVMALWQVAERLLSSAVEGPVAVNVVCGLVLASSLLWRRRAPRVMVAVLLAGGAASVLGGSAPSVVVGSAAVLFVAAFSVGRHLDAPARWWAAAVLGLGVATIDAISYGLGGFVFPLVVCAICAFVGGLLRDRAAMTRRLAEQVHELEALRDAGARDAVLDERRRIARELHDVVAHTVSVMVVQAAGARRQLDRDPERALAALRQVRATGEDTLTELERLFGLLHASDAAPSGLGDVPALVERTRAAGLPVELAVHGTPGRLGPDADLAAYRVVQEALTNTLKHAGPATARVQVRWTDEAVELLVADTGAGGVQGDGSRRGLAGMRERVALCGGDLQAGAGASAAGGFEVRARLPLAREEVQV